MVVLIKMRATFSWLYPARVVSDKGCHFWSLEWITFLILSVTTNAVFQGLGYRHAWRSGYRWDDTDIKYQVAGGFSVWINNYALPVLIKMHWFIIPSSTIKQKNQETFIRFEKVHKKLMKNHICKPTSWYSIWTWRRYFCVLLALNINPHTTREK